MENSINNIWNKIKNGEVLTLSNKELIFDIIQKIDSGELRICEKKNDKWIVNEWQKKSILLSFSAFENLFQSVNGEDIKLNWFDKIPNKFQKWNKNDFNNQNIRVLPGAFVRKGVYIGKNCIIMPSFINIGSYIGDGTMIDIMASIGSCAQIGERCHISASVVIGGVLEPLQAKPTIIEDNCFIGVGSSITEGVIVETGSVISSGVSITQSTKIVNRQTGEVFYGRIPSGSVVIAGNIKTECKNNIDLSISCAVIIKQVDLKTKEKTSINELLRC